MSRLMHGGRQVAAAYNGGHPALVLVGGNVAVHLPGNMLADIPAASYEDENGEIRWRDGIASFRSSVVNWNRNLELGKVITEPGTYRLTMLAPEHTESNGCEATLHRGGGIIASVTPQRPSVTVSELDATPGWACLFRVSLWWNKPIDRFLAYFSLEKLA